MCDALQIGSEGVGFSIIIGMDVDVQIDNLYRDETTRYGDLLMQLRLEHLKSCTFGAQPPSKRPYLDHDSEEDKLEAIAAGRPTVDQFYDNFLNVESRDYYSLEFPAALLVVVHEAARILCYLPDDKLTVLHLGEIQGLQTDSAVVEFYRPHVGKALLLSSGIHYVLLNVEHLLPPPQVGGIQTSSVISLPLEHVPIILIVMLPCLQGMIETLRPLVQSYSQLYLDSPNVSTLGSLFRGVAAPFEALHSRLLHLSRIHTSVSLKRRMTANGLNTLAHAIINGTEHLTTRQATLLDNLLQVRAALTYSVGDPLQRLTIMLICYFCALASCRLEAPIPLLRPTGDP